MTLRAAVALLAVLATTGCRSSGHADGRTIFTRSCAGCHTLTGREHGAPGGDLAIARLGVDDVAGFARVMPVRPPLSQQDAREVALYVVSVSRSLRARSGGTKETPARVTGSN